MLIFRYLAKEVFVTLASLTIILLAIFMSNQFVHYLGRAVNSHIPGMIIMKLMMLEIPNLAGMLLPLGFFSALLIVYGRMYAENEMTVLQACSYSPALLFKHSFIMAAVVSMIVMIDMLWLSPYIAIERMKLLRSGGVQTLIQTIVPGRFLSVPKRQDVFYVESMNRNHTKAKNIFLARQVLKNGNPQWTISWANEAFAKTDGQTQDNYLILTNGSQYEGIPGQADYRIIDFKQYKTKLPRPTDSIVNFANDLRAASSLKLLSSYNSDRRKAAELQWRLSIPLMPFTLALIAVPLSRVKPRSGKYAQLFPAIIIYIIYANFMFIARNWLAAGKVPLWLGMWWLHFVALALGLLLVWRKRMNTG